MKLFPIKKAALMYSMLLAFNSYSADTAFAIDGMVGTLPIKLQWLITLFKNAPETMAKRCLIIHGKPGNGKTTLVKKMAQMTDSELLRMDGPSIVDPYVGQGARNIVQLFADAQHLCDEHKKVIIFIDEIDAIGANNKSESRAEHKVALQQLWLEIDKHKECANMLIVFATNHMEKLDKTFLDRFGGNIIEIKNPDQPLRKQVLEHYFNKVNAVIDGDLIEKLAKQTDNLSFRCIEDLVMDIHMTAWLTNDGIITQTIIAQSLAETKAKFVESESEEDAQKRWQKIHTAVSIVSGSLGIIVSCYTIYQMLFGNKNSPVNEPQFVNPVSVAPIYTCPSFYDFYTHYCF